MSTITDLEVLDIRFPTSRDLDGSDAMNPDPDYSAAYVILRTDDSDGLTGHGLTFTIGRGTEVVVAAVRALAPLVVGRSTDELFPAMGAFWRSLVGDSQLRWIGPEKGAIHLATAAVVNAVWDLRAKRAGKPLWELLTTMTPAEIVELVDFRYLTDALTPDEAWTILQELAPTREARIDELLASPLPDDPWVMTALERYFPKALRKRYPSYLPRHPLRREIIATHVTNSMVNRVGSTFVHRLMETTGAKPDEIVRAAMLLRANALAKGYSGARVVTVELLIECLNRGVLPHVPSRGSVGASGDLAPLAHLALPLIGEGEAWVDGRRLPGAAALDAVGLEPVRLQAKEGLSLVNGTQFMAAFGALGLLRSLRLAKTADIACALSLEVRHRRQHRDRIPTRWVRLGMERDHALGHIRRTKNPGDGRSYLIRSTAAGRSTVERAAPVTMRALDQVARRLGRRVSGREPGADVDAAAPQARVFLRPRH